MSKEKQTQDALLEAIDIAVENRLKKLGFNYYVDGVIKGKNTDNTYNVLINGKVYNNIPSKNNFEYSVNDVVQVLIKNGNWNKKFIDDVSRHNKSVSEEIRGDITKKNVTDALGYTPPEQDTNTTYSDRDFVKSNDVYGQDSPNHTLRMGWSGSKFLLAVDHNGGLQPNTSNPTGAVHQMYQKDDILNLVYPVGSIYMSVNNTNPSKFIGGTWIAWGSGRVPVGVDTSDNEFKTVEKTGGVKTHTLTTSEMPSHNHGTGNTNYFTTNKYFASDSTARTRVASDNNGRYAITANPSASDYGDVSDLGEIQNTGSTGGSSAHNNLQPYITCYMWKRTK